MKLSKKLEYAIRALVYMASREGEKTFLIRDIASENGIPKKFLELILLEMKNAGLLSSKRGVSGGYSFLVHPTQITILDVYRAIEGELAPTPCISDSSMECEATVDPAWCGIKSVMADVKGRVEDQMSRWSVKRIVDLEKELKTRSEGNIMFYI